MRFKSLVSSFATFLALAGVPALHASVGNRITQAVSTSAADQVALTGTIVARAKRAQDLGEAPADRVLPSITLRFNMTAAQSAALDQLLVNLQNPASPQYHQWLTPAQFSAQFGLSSSDLSQVSAWLQSQGLTVTGVAQGGSFITVSGKVANVEKAFSTSIHSLTIDGEQHVSNVVEPSLPKQIAAVTGSITGLNDFHPHPRVHPRFTSATTGSHYIAPGDFYTIYDTNPLLTNNINGTGITIAVMGQTDISAADVTAFRSASGLSTTNLPTTKLYGTDPGTSTNDLPEASLDVEWSGAVAPSASILYVNSTDVVDISLTQAIDNNLAPIVTISYGDCESGFGASSIVTFNQLFKQANAQGQTIVGPAGDSGATDCDDSSTSTPITSATQGLAVDFPASSPYVTGMGGSEFNEGTGNYWNTTDGAYSGSAISYIPEMVWNDTAASVAAGGGLASGGGGASAFFTKPAYQVGTGVPNDFSRDVPDLSLNASPDHDGYLFCTQGFCTSGYRNLASVSATAPLGTLDVVGGTSVSTPAFAGILALLEQKIGTRVGNANGTIYALANSTFSTAVFHDITVGSNAQPCTQGSVNCPSGGTIGFAATTGYDEATGWGSVDAFNMVNDWQSVTPLGVSSGLANASSTTVTSSATSVTSGATVTYTVKVASATSTITTTPTGTVQFLVDGTANGSGVALVSGSASFTYVTTNLTSGTHTVSAAYAGDANYAGSKGSASLDIVSASSADFTLAASPASVTVASGSTASGITFTVTPVNGFTGAVTFTANSSAAVQGSFSINPVTVLGVNGGTTVLTIYAYTTVTPGLKQGTAKNLKATSSASSRSKLLTGLGGSGVAMAALFLLAPVRRRRRWSALLLILAGIGIAGLSGCGNTATVNTTTNTPSGTYAVTITATSGAVSHTSTVNLTVQ